MQSQVSPVGIAALLEQASRLIHSSGYAEGLYPAQWIALRYFSEALPSSRTTASLARFQGMSLGPVARTVRTLVDKGLLIRMSNPASRRADLIAVTPAGQNLLKRDPRSTLISTLETLSETQRETLASGLEAMLYTLFARSAAAGGANRLFEAPPLNELTTDVESTDDKNEAIAEKKPQTLRDNDNPSEKE
ncbi:hypothetical protein CCP2SC5_430002 [Azospirillaceae bacterium]